MRLWCKCARHEVRFVEFATQATLGVLVNPSQFEPLVKGVVVVVVVVVDGEGRWWLISG